MMPRSSSAFVRNALNHVGKNASSVFTTAADSVFTTGIPYVNDAAKLTAKLTCEIANYYLPSMSDIGNFPLDAARAIITDPLILCIITAAGGIGGTCVATSEVPEPVQDDSNKLYAMAVGGFIGFFASVKEVNKRIEEGVYHKPHPTCLSGY